MRIIGFDIGTHSLATMVRDVALGDKLKDQIVYYSVDSHFIQIILSIIIFYLPLLQILKSERLFTTRL